ncbi:MAG: radical SAM family heme chaperone HemW [Anaerolineales bacterium]|jgi:oxygen-independent coproporphyrinogen-3 oxidase
MTQPYSLYIHIPFCRHRCAYCDFNTYTGQEDSIPAYVEALCREITFTAEKASEKLTLHTIFFGGGTPSLLNPRQFESVLKTISDHFTLSNPETTIEANPGTVSLDGLRELRSLGINRISFGVQSANPSELRMLERAHSYFDVINAVTWARQAGFENLNLDLIYGLPLQTQENWSATVNLILGLAPEHLSLYALTLEHGTPFGRWSARGLMPLPDPDLAADMYEWAGETLETAGYEQYEISNWAKDDHRPETIDGQLSSVNGQFRPPSQACLHNLQYWRGLPYLAVGAGAHGYVNGYRYSNALRIKSYIERLKTDNPGSRSGAGTGWSLVTDFPLTPATVNHHKQTLQDDMGEFMMTGLRLTREGVSTDTFWERYGQEMETVFGTEIEDLIRLGLLEWQGGGEVPQRWMRVRLTRRGKLLGNQAFARFIS